MDSLESIVLDEVHGGPKVADTFPDSVEPRVLLLSKQRLLFKSLTTGRKSTFAPGRDYAFHRGVPLSDGSVFITGASGQEYKRHSCMLYTGSELELLHESEQGISAVSLVAFRRAVYLLGKWCEVYDLYAKTVTRIEEPISPHLNGGACVYNGNILLIGGINSKTAELFLRKEQRWAEVATLKDKMYNIGCIQIHPQEVLVFGGGFRATWLFNVETGHMKRVSDMPLSVPDTNVIENVPVLYRNAVYCYVGELSEFTLVKFDVASAAWEELSRVEPLRCCALF